MPETYQEILMIFTKNPIEGAVKTRLAQDIGDEPACSIYKKLVEHTRNITRPLQCDKIVWYSQFIDRMDEYNTKFYQKAIQKGHDLGERMQYAMRDAFNRNYQKALIIGTDCYQLTSELIREAFQKLDEYDVVFGPAKDGGYYLLGLNQFFPPLFMNKKWGTDTVLNDSIDDVKQAGLSYFLLPQLTDIDHLEDLDEHPSLKDATQTVTYKFL